MRFLDTNKWIKPHNKSTELFPTAKIRVSSQIGAVREESPPVSAQTDKGYSKGHKY